MRSGTHTTGLRFGRVTCYRYLVLLLITLFGGGGIGILTHSALAATQIYLPLALGNTTSKPVPSEPGIWSSPIAVSTADGSIWVVNPDSNSITVLDGDSYVKMDEIAVGQEPWSVAVTPDGGQIVVANRASGTLTVIDAASRMPVRTIAVGAEPGTVVLMPTGTHAFVTLMAEDAVAVVDMSAGEVAARIKVGPVPYAMALTGDGKHLYVTHLIAQPRPQGGEATDDGHQGLVTVLDVATNLTGGDVGESIELLPNAFGFPNRLTSITIAGGRAWLAHVRAAPAAPVGLTTTVFAAVASLDVTQRQEDTAAFVPLNDQEIFGSPVNNPTMAVPSPDGSYLYVVLSGSNLVEVVDISEPHQPALVKFIAVGQNPQGMALNDDGTRGFVMNYLARSITVLDLVNMEAIPEISTTHETLAPELLRGKILFNTAAIPKMTKGSWISCASCHFDGLPDGVTWIFPDGPRQTPMLWNAGETLPWHWSAALDEAQDVEETIQVIQHGLGLGPGADPPQLGATNGGRSVDLDALALFLRTGIRAPALPPPANEALGRALFSSSGCAACHGGPHWTISSLPGEPATLDPDGNGMVDAVLRDVGTVNSLDGRGATGFDVPSLLGVGLTSPYLHDGSMPTLEALLASGHPAPSGEGTPLAEAEIAELVLFLRSIGTDTLPVQAD